MARYRYADRFPWLLFLVLLAAIAFFWVLPTQMEPPEVRVEFTPAAGR